MVKSIAKCRKPIKYYTYTETSGNIYALKLRGLRALDAYYYKIVKEYMLCTKGFLLGDDWNLNFASQKYKEISREEYLLGKI